MFVHICISHTHATRPTTSLISMYRYLSTQSLTILLDQLESCVLKNVSLYRSQFVDHLLADMRLTSLNLGKAFCFHMEVCPGFLE